MKIYSKDIYLHNIKIKLNCNDFSLFRRIADQLQFPKFRNYANYINIIININVKYAAQNGERSDVFETTANNFSFNCWMKDIDIRIDNRTNSINACLLLPNALEDEAILHLIIIEPLRYVLKRKNIFFIHSAALKKGSKGLIICGGPSQGKSTLACALLAKGYRFLSDEFSILNKDTIYSFPLKIQLDKLDNKCRKNLIASGNRPDAAGELRPKQTAESLAPNITIFIYKARTPIKRAQLEPLSVEKSFLFLVSDKNNCLLYEKNPLLRKKQLQALAYICQNTRSYAMAYRLNHLDQVCRIIDKLLQLNKP